MDVQPKVTAANLAQHSITAEQQGIPVDWRQVSLAIHESAVKATQQLQCKIDALENECCEAGLRNPGGDYECAGQDTLTDE